MHFYFGKYFPRVCYYNVAYADGNRTFLYFEVEVCTHRLSFKKVAILKLSEQTLLRSWSWKADLSLS